MTQRNRFTATYLWPGSFVNETVIVELIDGTLDAALAAMPEDIMYGSHAFGFEITQTLLKRFVSDEGEERWLATGRGWRLGRWYFGETMTLTQVIAENMVNGGRHDILIANMRGNNWSTVVRTIAGNFQPVEDGDVVLPASEHPHHEVAST